MSLHHKAHDVEVAAQLFGWFLLLGGILWLMTVTYGTILLPVIVALVLYPRKIGHWPRMRKQEPTRVIYRGEHGGYKCPYEHRRPDTARACAERRARGR